jgi:nicotinate-nucleotide adenylyltransferase
VAEPTGLDAPLGVLGGTFDPVHHGHLRLALEVREALGLAQVRLMPSAQTNLRSGALASAAQRLAMLEAALAPGLAVDDREIARGGVSYTVDSLADLRAELGERPLCFIVGVDAWNALPRWHRWRELLDCAHLVVASRPGADLLRHAPLEAAWTSRVSDLHARPAGRVFACAIPLLPISATDVRARVAAGRSVAGLVPPAVIALIERDRLYRP